MPIEDRFYRYFNSILLFNSVLVAITRTDDTATDTSDSDYNIDGVADNTATTTVMFTAAGQETSLSFDMDIEEDQVREDEETFTLALSVAAGPAMTTAIIEPDPATVYIFDTTGQLL